MTDFTSYQRKHNPDAAIERRVIYEAQRWKKEKYREGWQEVISRSTLTELMEALQAFPYRNKFRVVKITTIIKPIDISRPPATDAEQGNGSLALSRIVIPADYPPTTALDEDGNEVEIK